MKKILVIRLGSLGDVILTSSLILNLKLNYPDSHITFFTKVQFREVVKCFNGIDEITVLPLSSNYKDFIRILNQFDNNNFDIVVDLHGNIRSTITRKYVTSSQTVVYPKRRLERYELVKNKTRPKHYPHTIDLYNDCVKQLGGTVIVKRPQVIPSEINDEMKFKINQATLVAPGAAHDNKQWPIERFIEVAIKLYEDYDESIIWAVSSNDRVNKSPAGQIPSDYFIEAKDYPIDKLAYLIAQSNLTIANDSGIAHLSSAVGTPTISVFGPTHPALGFFPRGLFDMVIDVDEWCRPCSFHGKKPCFREERFCFNRVTSEMVLESAKNLLKLKTGLKQAIFVDRDGTLIKDKDYLSDPDKVEFIDGSITALKKAQARGYKVVIVSNQSGVARGYFDIETVEKVNNRVIEVLADNSINIDGVYFCPHHKQGIIPEYTKNCGCRKPSPGMPEQAAKGRGIDLQSSWVIGDKNDDVRLGIAMGGKSVLVRSGYGKQEEQRMNYNCFNKRVLVADNLQEAVEKIISLE